MRTRRSIYRERGSLRRSGAHRGPKIFRETAKDEGRGEGRMMNSMLGWTVRRERLISTGWWWGGGGCAAGWYD